MLPLLARGLLWPGPKSGQAGEPGEAKDWALTLFACVKQFGMSFDEFKRATLGQILIVITEGKPDVRQLTLADVKERIAWIKAMREGKVPDGEPSAFGGPAARAPRPEGIRNPNLSFLERRLAFH